MKIKANNSNSNNNNNNNLNNIHNVTQILTRRKFWPFSKHKRNTITTQTTTTITIKKKLTCSKILWSGCLLSRLFDFIRTRIHELNVYECRTNIHWLLLRHITTVYMTVCCCMELNQRDYSPYIKSSSNVYFIAKKWDQI